MAYGRSSGERARRLASDDLRAAQPRRTPRLQIWARDKEAPRRLPQVREGAPNLSRRSRPLGESPLAGAASARQAEGVTLLVRCWTPRARDSTGEGPNSAPP